MKAAKKPAENMRTTVEQKQRDKNYHRNRNRILVHRTMLVLRAVDDWQVARGAFS